VFAMWMARRESLEKLRAIDFAAARDEGLTHIDSIIANYADDIPLSQTDFREYLTKHISFSIDDSMNKGMQLYFELAKKNSLINFQKPQIFI
jgi:predicted solute-binding protein